MKNITGKIAVVALLAVLLALIALNSFAVVPVGSTGILLTLGKVQDGSTLSEGVQLKLPFVQRIVTMDNRVKKLELDTEAFSRDIQTVNARLAVNYRLRPEMSFSVYKTYGERFEQDIIVPATHEVLKSVSAQYTAEELISKRADSSDKMREELDKKLTGMGISITDFNIIDFDFSTEFINAVESKQVSEQLKKKAAIENDTAIAQAQREKQVAITQAEASAEVVRIDAEAQANAVKLAADAEAYRLEAIGKNITEGTIRNTLAQNWNGKLPTVMGTGSAGILDFSSLLGSDAQ